MQSLPPHTEAVRTTQRNQMINITDRIERLVRSANIRDGMALIFVPHTTAAVAINEDADPDVKSDMLQKLSTLIPKQEPYYEHDEGNSDSHVKTSVVGNSVTVLIEQGPLVLGRWQGVCFCEFDGPRERTMQVKVVSFGST
ncbi:MAG TPA: secondary thiamine-phosphate synthase enzyme YjbQ [Tepidisphaeraceae bacterium]|jgi:secondary thiamine-phosphate synthase enzyme|nr:secondary thiamine-phosphate synthase enzyme YjbQ [Tepidisphaeraceae bacterium]